MSIVKNILRKGAILLLPHFLKLLVATLRVRIILPEEGIPGNERGTFFAFWHGKMVTGWLLGKRLFPKRPISAVVSLSGDGQILSDTLARLGFHLIRGSSSRGREAVRSGITDALHNREIVAITPDGPRGPLHCFKYGSIRLASEHQTPIVFARITHDKAHLLGSWDRFEIPLPFSRVTVHLHVVQVPAFPSEEDLRNFADELSTRFTDDTA